MKKNINGTFLCFALALCLFLSFGFTSCRQDTASNNNDLLAEIVKQNNKAQEENNGGNSDQGGSDVLFFDDFNGTALDASKWDRCLEWERQENMANHGWWNDSCSYVSNGNLVLEMKQENGKLISGAVRTRTKSNRDLFTCSKGIYEIKFKVENGSGFWYAFWLFAQNTDANIGNGAVNGAELDCFELLPALNNQMMSTIHWDAYGANHQQKATSLKNLSSSFYNSWHVYKFEWADTYYKCTLDGQVLWTMNGDEFGGMCQVPGYMKITTEFGNWGGALDSTIAAGGTKKMLVDYVKVTKR